MAWPTDFATGADVNAFANLIAFWKAIRERCWAMGLEFFPRENAVWDLGTITAITSTTVEDDDKTWQVLPPRWVNYSDDDAPYLPAFYDVVLNYDDLDHSRHVRAQIVSHTADTLTITSIADYVTAGWIPSVGWLNGKRFKIVKRNGLNWGDRWPKTPNDEELWRGDIAAGVSVTIVAGSFTPAGDYVGKQFKDGALTGTIREQRSDGTLVVDWLATAPSGAYQIMDGATELATGTTSGVHDGLWRLKGDYPPSKFDGADLLIGGAALMRISIISNTSTTIKFAKQTDGYNGNGYSIVAAGGRAWPGAAPDYPFRWYGGASAPYYTKTAPNDLFVEGIQTVRMPVTSIVWAEGTLDTTCEPVTHQAFDIDVWSELTEECSPADDCKSPDFFKTLRAIQLWIEANCTSFIPVDDYSGKTGIPNYTPARLFKDINAGYVGDFSATADGDGEYTFTITGVGASDGYFYTVVLPNGEHGASGFESGLSKTFTGGTAGKTYKLIVARGWTRKYPREFAHAYARSAFIPDIQTGDFGESSVVDPPTNEYPGMWVSRDASDNYSESDQFGFTQEIGPAFITGTRARYRGDNWGDPAVSPHTKVEGEDGPLDAAYWRDLWLGRFNPGQRIFYDPMLSGRMTYGGRKWFRQSDHDWWGYPIGRGVCISHTGTATAGTTTTLTDTTRTYIPDDEVDPVLIPFWNSTDNGPRFVGMMLEVSKTVDDVNGDPQTVTYHTPITAHNDTTITFAAVPAFVIPATETTAAIEAPALDVNPGDSYAIREPYRRNWFIGRKITIRKTGEADETKTVTRHDAGHLWFDSDVSFDIDDTCTFTMSELRPGYVYNWDGAKWVPVTGTTHAGNELKPAHVSTFGTVMKGDYIAGHVFKQIYDALNALVWTRAEATWNPFDPLDPPVGDWANVLAYGGTNPSDPPTSEGMWDAFLALYESQFPSSPLFVALVSGPPGYSTSGTLVGTASSLIASIRFSWGTVDPPDFQSLNRAVDIFCYSMIDGGDTEPGETSTTTPPDGLNNTFQSFSNYQFDPHGLALNFRAYGKIHGFAASDDDKFYTGIVPPGGYVAPVDKPHEYGSEPNEFGGTNFFHGSAYVGFHIRDSVAIVKWNVPGGFTYTA